MTRGAFIASASGRWGASSPVTPAAEQQ